jgi:hypothetical protein
MTLSWLDLTSETAYWKGGDEFWGRYISSFSWPNLEWCSCRALVDEISTLYSSILSYFVMSTFSSMLVSYFCLSIRSLSYRSKLVLIFSSCFVKYSSSYLLDLLHSSLRSSYLPTVSARSCFSDLILSNSDSRLCNFYWSWSKSSSILFMSSLSVRMLFCCIFFSTYH